MKQPLQAIWMTAGDKHDGTPRRVAAFMIDGEWTEIHHGETILVHKEREQEFRTRYLKKCKGPIIYKTAYEAEHKGKV